MEGIFYFVVENSVFKRKDDNSQGVGLKNCRKRLDMMYGNRYTLETGENDKKVFTVKLKILPTKK
jgi:sensor histidine kinase YesM